MKQTAQSDGKEFTGTVVSTKMHNTVIVATTHIYRHPLYKKAVRKTRRFAVHVKGQDVFVGDTVVIKETKPISKTKHFRIIKKRLVRDN